MIGWHYQTKKLHAVANGNDTETEKQDLEKVGKGNGGKSAVFNLKDAAVSYDLLNWICLCLTN